MIGSYKIPDLDLLLADAQVEKIMAMSDEDILAWARSEGIDPEQFAREMREKVLASI